jgi:hypothetical protein
MFTYLALWCWCRADEIQATDAFICVKRIVVFHTNRETFRMLFSLPTTGDGTSILALL